MTILSDIGISLGDLRRWAALNRLALRALVYGEAMIVPMRIDGRPVELLFCRTGTEMHRAEDVRMDRTV